MELRKNNKGVFELRDTVGIKIGIIAKNTNLLNYNDDAETVRSQEKSLLKTLTGIEEKNIIMLRQVHGENIVIINAIPESNSLFFSSADGMITGIPGVCLVISTADCVPVFIFDSRTRILGAVHSGWRGCRNNITGKLVNTMAAKFKSHPAELSAYILPFIGADSYEIKEDVAIHFPEDTKYIDNRMYLDLGTNIYRSLIEFGINKKNIFKSRLCTFTNKEFYSFRHHDKGRNLNYCYIVP